MRNTNKDTILILDFLYDICERGIIRHIVGGSSEGTEIAEGDVDKLIVWRNINIFQRNEQIHAKDGVCFVMDPTNCQQGYTKLKLVQNIKNKDLFLDDYGKTVMDMVEKYEMGYYLSNEKVVSFFLQFLSTTTGPSTDFRHGPCATSVCEKNTYFGPKIISKEVQDYAQGFEVRNTTKEGGYWLEKMNAAQMRGHWPTKETMEKIREMKCHVVAVGCHNKSASHLEWRISYTLWERELIWSFRDVQLHCLIILKLLRKYILKKISSDITSFHLKNIVFWESVECSYDMLQSNFLITLLRKCTMRLIEAIRKRKLEHFIHRSRNLLDAKLTDDNKRCELINCLNKKLIESKNIEPLIMKCIEKDKRLRIHATCPFTPVEYSTLWNNYHLPSLKEHNPRRENHTKIYRFGMQVLAIKLDVLDSDYETYNVYLDNFNKMENLDVSASFLKIAKDVILSCYWLSLAARRLDGDRYITDSDVCNLLSRYTDALSGRLNLCTYFIRDGRYSKADSVIEEFLMSGPKLLIYCGSCSMFNGINIEKGQATYVFSKFSPLEVPEDSFPFVHDVVIKNVNDDLYPPVIQIQSSLEYYVPINPVFYMYYLKVVCDVSLQRNADESMVRLRDAFCVCVLQKDNFRHLNLLGYAYFLTKRYDDAYVCFMYSIHDTHSRNIPNSVFYLLLILIHHLRFINA